jgi:hypothetical protein
MGVYLRGGGVGVFMCVDSDVPGCSEVCVLVCLFACVGWTEGVGGYE